MEDVLTIAADFREQARLVFVYIKEAHASDGWALGGDDGTVPAEATADGSGDACLLEPRSTAERTAVARRFRDEFLRKRLAGVMGRLQPTDVSMVVDGIENAVECALDARPEKIVVLRRGVVVFTSGIGPFQYRPDELRAWLEAGAGRE